MDDNVDNQDDKNDLKMVEVGEIQKKKNWTIKR